MAKKKNKENSAALRYIIPAIAMIVVVGMTLARYGVSFVQDAKKQVNTSYESLAYDVACQYEREVYAVSEIAKAYAEYVGQDEDLFSENNLNVLKSIKDTLSISNAYIIDPKYAAIDTKGNKYEAITELPGYEEAFKGNGTVTKFITNVDGEKVMLVFAPINTKIELKGYVLMEYKPNVMDKLLQVVKFSPQNTYALISSDGDVVEMSVAGASVFNVGDNILDETELVFVEGTKTVFRQTVQIQRNDIFKIKRGSDTEYVFVSPIADYQAVVAVCVDEALVNNSLNKASKTIHNMLVTVTGIVIAFLALFIFMVLFNRARHNMESEDLQNKADTDQLTDLYNKMATERLIKEYLQGEGSDKVSMLFLLDIDNFKKINDTMGHAFGDEVLMNLGHQIRAWFRVNDVVGRIGGDEFMVFIKDVKDENVIKREGSRIMQFFEGFQVGDYTKYSPTASIGGAVFPTDAKDFESLYKAADKAVYKAKKEGKNRVAFYGDLNKQEQETETDKSGRD